MFLLLALQAWPEERISLEGYYKNFSIFFMPPAYKWGNTILNAQDMGAVNNRLRLKLALHPSSHTSIHFAYDLSPRIQDSALFREDVFPAGLKPLEYRFNDFRSRLFPEPGKSVTSFGLFHNLDRFYLTIKTKYADIFVGRQAIAWGSARVINPTDIIAPFAFNELDIEERRGVDAVRIRIPLGTMDELDVGFVSGRDFDPEKNAFFLRGKIYVYQTDVTLLLLGFRKHLLFGFDLTRSLGRAGFWFEAAYVIPEFFRKNKIREEKNYFRTSVGLDHNLSSKAYAFMEYHFNSAGKNQPEQYSQLFETSAFQDGSVYLMGKHYLNIGTIYQVSPLTPFTGIFIFNLSDGSIVFSPAFEYNIAENIYLSAGAYIGIGNRPEQVLCIKAPCYPLWHSEFGSYPDMLFSSFRIYF